MKRLHLIGNLRRSPSPSICGSCWISSGRQTCTYCRSMLGLNRCKGDFEGPSILPVFAHLKATRTRRKTSMVGTASKKNLQVGVKSNTDSHLMRLVMWKRAMYYKGHFDSASLEFRRLPEHAKVGTHSSRRGRLDGIKGTRHPVCSPFGL